MFNVHIHISDQICLPATHHREYSQNIVRKLCCSKLFSKKNRAYSLAARWTGHATLNRMLAGPRALRVIPSSSIQPLEYFGYFAISIFIFFCYYPILFFFNRHLLFKNFRDCVDRLLIIVNHWKEYFSKNVSVTKGYKLSIFSSSTEISRRFEIPCAA